MITQSQTTYEMPDVIRILHVDDDPAFAELTAETLEREHDSFSVTTAATASEGIDCLATDQFDCIVSDYQMPGRNGIEFLNVIRDEYPDLPFILFTGKGSEEIASEAISAGVTDYLQKESGTDQYTVLANRIQHAVEHERARRERQRHLNAIETAQEGISILNENEYFVYVNQAYADLYGYEPDEIIGEHWEMLYRDEDIPQVREEALTELKETGSWHGKTTGLRADGTTFTEDHVLALTEDNNIICTVRDITETETLREKYELVVQASTDAFWDWDLQTDTVSRSQEYLSQFGYEPSDLGPGPEWWLERIHPDDRERIRTALHQARDNPEATFDETYRFQQRDGSYGYLRTRGYVMYDSDDEPVRMVGAHIDVTEQKERERELQRYEAFVTNSSDIISILDPDGTCRYVSSPVTDLLGHDPADLCGPDAAKLVHPEDADDVAAACDEVMDSPDARPTVQYRYKHADGSWVWVESTVMNQIDNHAIEGLLFVTREITDRKERERRLKQRTEELEELTHRLDEQYRYLFEEAPIMAVVTRAEDDEPIIEDCNQRFVDRLGYDRDDVLDQELAELYTADSEQKLLDGGGYERALEGEFVHEERELIAADGEHVETLLRAVPRRDARKDIVGTLAMYVDISERRELEREKARLEEFTSVVSHDLRNPLNVAQARVELATEDCESEHLPMASGALTRMEELIEDMLTLAQSGEDVTEPTTVELGHLSEHAWQNVETKTASLHAEIEQTIRGEKTRVQQLFENLYRNAIEHGGQEVTVTVGERADGFYVEDTGPGIPEEEQSQIFEAGYSTTDDGTGFGLSIVKQVCEAHGWEISVTNGSEGGARFEIQGVDIIGE